MRHSLPVWLLFLVPVAVQGGEPPSRRKETVEERFYLAPGIHFGARSQELSLSIGAADVAFAHAADGDPFLHTGSFGARLNLVGGEWSPAAVHALIFLSRHVWIPFSWPQGLEIAAGYGGGGGRGYGIGQLSYIVGIASRIEATATWQSTVGTIAPRPGWFSTWVFGLRYGFDLARPKRTIVTVEPRPDEPPARPEPHD